MGSTLIELTLGEDLSLNATGRQSFNNDSSRDSVNTSFRDGMNFSFSPRMERVPSKYLHKNVHHYNSSEIHMKDKKIIVGEYCNHGVIVPRKDFSIIFDKLYNCSPLISLIEGEEEHISFLHTWADYEPETIDRQVKHWMEIVSSFGEVKETVFAPRKNNPNWGSDTEYEHAQDYLREVSKRTIWLNRNVDELRGMVDGRGVYFMHCGYHLWDNE